MAKTSTSWGAGKSGNPKGRPRKGRTLTDALREGGERKMYDDMGRLMPVKDVLAWLIWDFVTRGEISMAGLIYQVNNTEEWLRAVKWLYAHVDGGAELEMEAIEEEGDAEEAEPTAIAGEMLEEMKRRLSAE
jgi:hypothetical protein